MRDNDRDGFKHIPFSSFVVMSSSRLCCRAFYTLLNALHTMLIMNVLNIHHIKMLSTFLNIILFSLTVNILRVSGY